MANSWPSVFTCLFFTKDRFKELLFESTGGRIFGSQDLRSASMSLLYHVLEQHLKAGASLVIEANFKPQSEKSRLLALRDQYQCLIVELYCHAPAQVLRKRFNARIKQQSRHPCHRDIAKDLRDQLADIRARPPLRIGEAVFEVDTKDFAGIDYDELLNRISEAMGRAPAGSS